MLHNCKIILIFSGKMYTTRCSFFENYSYENELYLREMYGILLKNMTKHKFNVNKLLQPENFKQFCIWLKQYAEV
jgi:hypothetical protein